MNNELFQGLGGAHIYLIPPSASSHSSKTPDAIIIGLRRLPFEKNFQTPPYPNVAEVLHLITHCSRYGESNKYLCTHNATS